MKYFSMFSGVGGFEKAIQTVIPSSKCVGFSEIDKYAIKVYERHFNGHRNYGDATTINPDELPDFDLLVGGFPCQAFSIAGKRKGFDDTRGTLFFDIARILENKRPRHLVLENVKGLLSHDGGKTFQTILGVLSDLGYGVEWQVLNSKDFGVPQNRERIFFIGHLRGECGRKVFPISKQNTTTLRQNTKAIALHNNRKIATVTDTVNTLSSTFRGSPDGDGRPAIIEINQPKLKQIVGGSQGNRVYDPSGISSTIASQAGGLGAKTGLYQLDNTRIRRLTPVECERLQGFQENWTAGESDTQRYKMCENAVTVNVIEAIISSMIHSNCFEV